MASERICIKLMDVKHDEFTPFKNKLEKDFNACMVCSKETYWCEYDSKVYKELYGIKEHFEKQDKIFLFTKVQLQSWESKNN